ncbi:MAG: hypothetical protein SCALA702_03040 [Melioribacteraceae bacterium]|nr:MAG: hypothetical protein SCALA702_03040 [Melioribacteraceae bacterium]
MKTLKLPLITFYILAMLFSNLFGSKKDDLESAEEAAKAGYLTKKELKIFKSERDVDLLKKPYGDIPLRGVYNLMVYDLYPNSEEPYHLEKEISVAEAIWFAMHLREKADEIEKGNYQHPFRDIPEEYEKYVGYAYENELLPKSISNNFVPDGNITFVQYEIIMLKMLGYVEGTDFTEENVRTLAREKDFDPPPLGKKAFIKAKAVEMANYTLGVSMKESHTIYLDYLISKNIIPAKAEKFISDQAYKRYTWDTRDNFSEVYWKYQRKYDFVRFLDCRNGPAPIHPAVSWPNKNVTLDYAGYIKIKESVLEEKFMYKLVRDILSDLNVDKKKIDKMISKLKSDGKADHIDYYTRMIDIKKKRNYVTIDMYLENK